MIGIIQVSPAPYRERTFVLCNEKMNNGVEVATFPDGMDTHPEWEYKSLKEDYIGEHPKSYVVFGRTMVFNSDVKSWIRSKKWDALLIEGYNSFTNIYALLYAFIHHIPVILGVDSVENPGHKSIKARLYKKVSAFWVPGKRSRDYLISEGVPEEKIFLGKYTYDLLEIKNRIDNIDKNSILKRLNIKNTDIVFLFVGKLIPSRNVNLLLKAFSNLTNDNVKLVIIGDGPDEHLVSNCSDNRLIYIPRVPLAELYDYYAIADVYVHPGAEPYSLAVVQAVATDTIVVSSSSVGAIDDVLIEGQNGYTFEYGDYDGLYEKLQNVLNNYTELKTSACKQGEIIRNNKSVEFSSEQLLKGIDYVLKSKNKAGIINGR